MEKKREEKAVKKNFDFVDTIRCISMMGIVFEHCAAVRSGIYSSLFDTTVETSLIQSFKFSTIAFFLIGGFLINHKFQEYTAKEYLKNRFKSTIRPWLFWLLVFVALMILDRYVAYVKGRDNTIVTDFFGYAWSQFVFGLFYTSSWFVLNFLLCICILLIFKKYLYNWWFGAILGIISLVYSFNLYHNWFVTKHSMALFGFVFYLWLGVILNRYFDKVMNYIKRIKWPTMILTVAGFFALAVLESFELLNLGSEDAYNTLRVSNIFYSFAMFALLLKIGSIDILQKKMEPRQTTFGIYLIHYVLIVRLLPLIFQPLKLKYLDYSIWVNSGIHISRFLIVYGISFGLVKLIRLTRFKWIVGG
nr:acyltransferase [Pedobacter panaciterrae]